MSDLGTVHASAVVIGDRGLLIRGAPGSGKSSMARMLIREAERSGRFARLVSDDRVRLSVEGGRILARTVPEIAGLMELRGVGVVAVDYEPAAVVRLVIDCTLEYPPRMPNEESGHVVIAGVVLPRLACCAGAESVGVVFEALARLETSRVACG